MKVKVLVDVVVECEPPTFYGYGKTFAERIDSRAHFIADFGPVTGLQLTAKGRKVQRRANA